MNRNYFAAVWMILVVLVSCDDSQSGKKQQQISVSKSFTTVSELPPFKDDDNLLKMMNHASMGLAAQEGRDSATVLTYKDSSGEVQTPPQYKNTYFFVATTDSSLVNDFVYSSSFDLHGDTLQVHSIDFTGNFAFVVTHPPTGVDYADGLYITDTSDRRLIVSLNSYGIPKGQDDPVLPDTWKTSVYELPARRYDSLGVIFEADTTFFSLK